MTMAAVAWRERPPGRPPDMLPYAGEAVWRIAEAGLIHVADDAGCMARGLLNACSSTTSTACSPSSSIRPGRDHARRGWLTANRRPAPTGTTAVVTRSSVSTSAVNSSSSWAWEMTLSTASRPPGRSTRTSSGQ
jgi:hypothetical protein